MIGTVLAGRYRVTGLLGGGGMAVVYKATDQVTGETVAVKALRSEYVADGAFLRRLRREADAVRRLSHPGVVAVRDVGEDGGHPFLVLEYVEGITLKQYIREKAPLPPAEAVGIACRVLAVLEHAHQHGVIHRDVKPQNILITPDARVMVTDFGIARASGTTTTVVDQGAMVGTAQYFAPEQARGMPATERSDLYAVGVILFEMLTGRLPFDGDSPVAVAMQHLGQQPPLPSALNPAVPRALEAIVLKALEKNPDRRYPSAAAMRADLENFLAGRPVTALARQEVQDTLVAGPRGGEVARPARAAGGSGRHPGRDGAPSLDGRTGAPPAVGRAGPAPDAAGGTDGRSSSPGRGDGGDGGPRGAGRGDGDEGRPQGPSRRAGTDGGPPLGRGGGPQDGSAGSERAERTSGRRAPAAGRVGSEAATAAVAGAAVAGGVSWLAEPETDGAAHGGARRPAGAGLEAPGARPAPAGMRDGRGKARGRGLRTAARAGPGTGPGGRPAPGPAGMAGEGPRAAAGAVAGRAAEHPGVAPRPGRPASQAAPGVAVTAPAGPGARRRRALRVALAVFLLLAVSLAAGAAVRQWLQPPVVTVPAVEGLPLIEAQNRLEQAGLQWQIVEERYDNSEVNTVIEQRPEGGERVRMGQTVELVVSKGPQWLSVPDVRGLVERDARLRLENAGLVVEVRYEHADEPEGVVVDQDPGPGSPIQAGMTVYLTVSRGPEPRPVVVPSLFGLTVAGAREELRAAGLVAGAVEERHSPYPAGTVIGQDPGAAASVERGSRVDLVVSKGPAPAPPAQGQPGATHQVTLDVRVEGSGQHLLRVEVEDAAGRRTVYEQTVQGGQRVQVPVSWQGERAQALIYVDGQLVEQRPLEASAAKGKERDRAPDEPAPGAGQPGDGGTPDDDGRGDG
ncbi:MAG TPA: PASTA domain-containing protein [Thermaerobacter sp.]